MEKVLDEWGYEDVAATRRKNFNYKRLVVFCDGTGQQSDAPIELEKDDPRRALYDSYEEWVPASNVTRMCTLVATHKQFPNGRQIPQISFYQNGVATGSGTALAKGLASGVGTGLNENVAEVYVWLLNNWEAGDEIFIFGFSRGAYTARSIAGLISNIGLTGKEDIASFPRTYDFYMHRTDTDADLKSWNDIWNNIPGRENSKVPIKVLGVWDTVASLGLPIKSLNKLSGWEHHHAFHDSQPQSNVENAFHALALDEERPSFSPTLMFLRPDGKSKTNLKQCWFPGVHSDVGGSYRDAQRLDSSDISLAWMITQCQGLLEFDISRLSGWEERHKKHFLPELPSMYAAMPSHDSVDGVFVLDGRESRTPGEYELDDILSPDLTKGTTNETFHPSIRARLLKLHDKDGRWKKRQILNRLPKEKSRFSLEWLLGKHKEDDHEIETIEYTLEWGAQALAEWKLVRVEETGKKPFWKWVKEEKGKRIEIPEWTIDFEHESFESKFLREDDIALLSDVAATKKLPVVVKHVGVIEAVSETFHSAVHAVAHQLPGHKHEE